MRDFNNLLACEFYKISKKKTFLKIGFVVLVVILLTLLIGLVMDYFLAGLMGQVGSSSYEEQLESLKIQLDNAQTAMDSSKLYKLLYFNEVYGIKAQIALYEYLIDNNIPVGATQIYTNASTLFGFNYYTFTVSVTSVLMTIVTIFLIVMACRTTVGEYNSGAMKMQLIRPIDKMQFYTAKWLGVYLSSIAILFVGMAMAFLIGVIAFGSNCPDVVMVLDAVRVVKVSPFTALFISYIVKAIKLFAILHMVMFINSFIKKNSTALIFNIILIIVEAGTLIEMALSAPYIGFVGFFMNLNWETMLTTASPQLRGMRLWTSIPITFIWIGIFMYFSYRNFKKRPV